MTAADARPHPLSAWRRSIGSTACVRPARALLSASAECMTNRPSATSHATCCRAKSATSGSRTPTGCASRSRFPNTYFVGMSNLGFQTIYRLFNDQPDIVCERVFLPPKQELQRSLDSGARIVTLESQTPVARLRRVRLLRVVRVGLHQRPDAAAARRAAAARGRTRPAPSARPHRRRRDLRQPRAARAVCRRHRRRRRRSARARRCSKPSTVATSRAELLRSLAQPARLLRPVVLRRRVRRRTAHRALRAAKRHRRARRWSGRRRSRRPTPSIRPSTSIFTPDTEFGSRFLIEVVRGCANLCRFCWAGYNYLPVRAFPTERILELARKARAAFGTRRPGLDRALRPPGHRAHPAQPEGHGLLDQPGVAAPRRPDADDRVAAARRAASAR